MQIGERSISFIIRPVSFSFETPARILKGFTLREAKFDANEMGKILGYLKYVNAFHGPYTNFGFETYEHADKTIAESNGVTKKDKKEFNPSVVGIVEWIDPDTDLIKVIDTQWKYWVIAATPSVEYRTLEDLCTAFTISNCGLNVGVTFRGIGSVDHHIRNNIQYNEYPLKFYYENDSLHFKNYQRVINQQDIQQIIGIFHLLENFDHKRYNFIIKAINEYKNLLSIPRESFLLLVGLFSVLELLLTHDERKPGASGISWQLQKKIPLLNHLFDTEINFSEYFMCNPNTKEETIIDQLYKKRCIAVHGNQDDVIQKSDAISKGNDIKFLRLLARKTITTALRLPRLVEDIRRC